MVLSTVIPSELEFKSHPVMLYDILLELCEISFRETRFPLAVTVTFSFSQHESHRDIPVYLESIVLIA